MTYPTTPPPTRAPAQRPQSGVFTHPIETGPRPKAKPGTKPPAKPPAPPPLSQQQQNAFDLMASTLASWGLSALSGELKKLIVGGDTATDTLALALSQTDAYKQRFAGNELRKKQGLAELNPAQYIAMEEQYRQVLSQYGMPKGFYDQHSDFTNWIGGDVSAAEIQSRAQIASQQYQNAPQEFRDYWKNFGLTSGDAIASILDPSHGSLADLQQKASAVAVGGSALQQGINVTAARATQLAQNGVTLDGARQAYSRIAASAGTDQSIAQRFGTTFDQTQEENDLLLNDGAATAKRAALYSSEASLFGGRGGGASQQSASTAANY